MSHQSEQQLENELISQLTSLKYEQVSIADETDLIDNLKAQIQKHNDITLSDTEFAKILNHLTKGTVFEKAKTLRDRFALTRDDGTTSYISFIDMEHRCQNEYQVTHQITMTGSYENRYDVTLLVNGLPLCQIELKRRGLEIKEAFNQTNRYHRHSYGAGIGLFQYIQIFVISNGVNTKYYANNRVQSFQQTFYWTDENNHKITKLEDFAKVFLEPCHLSKMITKYIVLHESDKILMVLRPYQYYATEAIVRRVQETDKNGYIWHTTGSGKTLTSFKAAQILVDVPEVEKVVFVVDRKDLDYQTIKEFNAFSKGSIDATDNTHNLVKQLTDDTKLIVTTIQKLNTAISKKKYLDKVEHLADQKIVFIFDECHRSQFGDTHKRIVSFFENAQLFGFTGTPILAENNIGNRTTADLFDTCLHKYVITDAIADENVLRFSVEYVGKYREKTSSANNLDIQVEDIDTRELLEDEGRLEKIVDYIIAHHGHKTHGKEFNAIFAVSSIDVLTKYYELFKAKKERGEHNLRIATIFSYTSNEDDKDATGLIDEDPLSETGPINQHSRDRLESYIQDYNEMFATNYTTKDSKSYYQYYNDIAKRTKDRQIDILLVVNMFLTGFDARTLNTLYVDKNLRYHGLIQAFSRTNRILNEKKSQGNIVSFRNLKARTDEAITLFSNKDAIEIVIMEPYEVYRDRFNEAVTGLLEIVPTIDSVNELLTDEEKLAFVQQFRLLMRLRNTLSSFADFAMSDTSMSAQDFEDYKSKYLDLYESIRTRSEADKVSILDDVDFELELIQRDEITVSYILSLLEQWESTQSGKKKDNLYQGVMNLVQGDPKLRSKKELIMQFIEHMTLTPKPEDQSREDQFFAFVDQKKQEALDKIVEEEKLKLEKVQKIVNHYLMMDALPLDDDISQTLVTQPKILERKATITRVGDKIKKFLEVFVDGL